MNAAALLLSLPTPAALQLAALGLHVTAPMLPTAPAIQTIRLPKGRA